MVIILGNSELNYLSGDVNIISHHLSSDVINVKGSHEAP